MPFQTDSRPLFALALLLGLLAAACATTMRSTASSSASANDDATITARVRTVLLNDTQINATKITVSTVNGVVTMTGQVRSKADEERAVQLARGVSGVRDVRSALQVG